jgi:Ser/Thr protein kinase RdoA (MazF antagonist)
MPKSGARSSISKNAAMDHLAARGVQRVAPARNGESIVTVTGAGGARHFARLLTYLPGKVWAVTSPHTSEMLASLGRLLGSVDAALDTFEHPAAHRPIKWDLARASWVRDYLAYIADRARRAMVERRIDQFESDIGPRLAGLRRSVIHNDANDYNVLVGGNPP